MWTKRDRLDAVLNGEQADRTPVSGWRHFTDDEHSGAERFAEKMMEFQNRYDWDFIKLQPRASHFCELWDGVYDYSDYKGGVVAPCTKPVISKPEDLEKITLVSPEHPVFSEQLEAVKRVVEQAGDTPVFHTIFCPASIFQMFYGVVATGRYREAAREDGFVTAITKYPELAHRALKNIAESLAGYAEKLVSEGMYGCFYAASGLARSGYLTPEEWKEFVEPYDRIILEALKPSNTMVHTCGIYANPERFASWPIRILHWAESAPGNPKLEESASWIGSVVPMGGVDERLFGQNEAPKIGALARSSVKKMKGRPFILAPDCSLSVHTTDEELRAFRSAVEA